MSHFSRLLPSLYNFLSNDLWSEIFPQILQFLHFLRTAPSPPSPEFRISHIEHLLRTQDETSDAVTSALKELRSWSPLPPVQVIPKGVWPNDPNCHISVQTHLKSNFTDAVNLLKATGRDLSAVDEKYLHLLLTHDCGWSATYPDHMNDSWVKYIFPYSIPSARRADAYLGLDDLPGRVDRFPRRP